MTGWHNWSFIFLVNNDQKLADRMMLFTITTTLPKVKSNSQIVWVIYNFIVILMQVQQARSVHRLLDLTTHVNLKYNTLVAPPIISRTCLWWNSECFEISLFHCIGFSSLMTSSSKHQFIKLQLYFQPINLHYKAVSSIHANNLKDKIGVYMMFNTLCISILTFTLLILQQDEERFWSTNEWTQMTQSGYSCALS